MKKYFLLLIALSCLAVGTQGAVRNRVRLGYRGRLSTQLIGRQSTTSNDTIQGTGSDAFASAINQADAPRSTSGNLCPMYRRVPLLIKAANGDYLLLTDMRSGASDSASYGIVLNRSTDRGQTWQPYTTVYNHATYGSGTDWIAFGSAVCDYANSGSIWVFFTKATGSAGTATLHTVYYTKSTNHGATWAAPVDITATTKVAGGGTTPANHAFPAVNWTHCVPTCTAGIQLTAGPSAGRMLVPFDHRTVDFSSNTTTWSHVIKSDDGGTTWSLFVDGTSIGGLDQTNASNNGANECSIVETQTAGRLVMHIRSVNAATTRYQSVSTNSGATWSTMVALTNLVSPSTSSDVKQCGDTTLATYVGDKSFSGRSILCLATSTDQGATWPAATSRTQISGAYAGYSSVLVDGNNVLVAYEAGSDNNSGSSIPVYSHAIRTIRFNKTWLAAPTIRYSQWFFNEEASGTTARTIGGGIPDYGNMDVRASCGTLAAPPSYTSNGIAVSAGNADKIVLCPADNTALDIWAADTLTVEVEATITAASNGVLASRYVAPSGFQLECLAGKLKGTLADGSTTITVTGGTTINDGSRHCYAFVRNVTTDTINVYIDGVPDATAVADTTTGNCATASSALILGDNTGGTLPIGATIHSARVSRGIPQNMLVAPVTKSTPQQLRHYNPPTLAFPTLTGNAVPSVWLYQTSNLGLDFYGDNYCTEHSVIPPPANAAFRSMVDGSPNRKRYSNTEGSRYLYTSDANMGPCLDVDYQSGAVFNGGVVNVNAYGASTGGGVDFIQNTGQFTICFCVNFKASTGLIQTVASNNDMAGATGFSLYRADGANSKLNILIWGGGSQFNEAIATSPNLPYGTTFFVAIVGQGTGVAVKQYTATISNPYSSTPVQPTVTSADGSVFGSIAGQPFATNSGQYLIFGTRASADRFLNALVKNFMIFNSTLSAADINALALYNVSG